MSATTSSISPWSTLPDDLRPMLDPPPGVTPNFNIENHEGQFIIVSVAITLPLAIVACSLRLYTRAFLIRSFQTDDYLTIFAMVSALAFEICAIHSSSLGLGKDMWNIPWTRMTSVLEFFIATELIYFVSICFCKLTILAFYLRFIVSMNKIQRFFIRASIAAVIIYNIVTILILLFACRPVRALWNFDYDRSKCRNTDAIFFVNAALNTVTDLAILVIPLPMLWTIQMRTSKKIGLIALFITGGL
ncbi:hypothetical protein Dda_3299 [Drechslerella dactyloides]|uniref:Rhodopsin domain-containing protein n=1 Tax=Drechslerella dactyloides TaxID=74499 RepID=A0AAD6J2N3_DREDA|nr:hypothetical protein Dda_3299 [Drechslerella dactyloides]